MNTEAKKQVKIKYSKFKLSINQINQNLSS